ncbi:hypothetical protein AVEN_222859-1 [Araneus ventricosus]|uniref:Uncharacterized protein n=1 Tax=Araneus ventricosus TaxID=182803 RepID=A0A4Y2AK21_ARAVE|nr:hypothetical protein AVEN_222859-1 [Araneus ventricosus]
MSGAGVTVPNEPDGNSDLDEQMEMSPPLAANPTPIRVIQEVPDLTPFYRRAVATYEKLVSDLPYSRCQHIRDAIRHLGKLRNLVFMATEYEEVTLTLEEGNTLFGICSLDNCNAKEVENKLIFEEAERKRNVPSSSSTNNVRSNSSVTSHDNVNVTSNNNNPRKRAAPNEPECSNNSRIRLDKDGFIYPSRRNSVPKRNLNAGENSDILLQNKYADIERLPVQKEGPTAAPKIQPLMVRDKNNYKEMLKKLNNKFGKVNAVLANEYIKVYPETAEEHRDMQKFCR